MNSADAKALDDYEAIIRAIDAKDAEIARLRDTLKDARDKGLIYWEPNTVRGHIAKNNMIARIDDVLAHPLPSKED